MIHLAPRVMDFGDEQFHIPIRLAVGILVGLFDSTALASAYLAPSISKLNSNHRKVQIHTHVDDVHVVNKQDGRQFGDLARHRTDKRGAVSFAFVCPEDDDRDDGPAGWC